VASRTHRNETNTSGGEGIRTSREIPERNALSEQGGAESGALAIKTRPIDPDLATLINAWQNLPEPIKAGILAMILAAKA